MRSIPLRRAAAVLGGVALIVSPLPAYAATPSTTPSATPSKAAPDHERLEWATCPDGAGPTDKVGMECASLRVPVDWNRPDGRTLTLMVGRLPATGKREHTVVMNPGGPTGNVIEYLATYSAESYADLRTDTDVVTWDLRGGPVVPGLSTALGCEFSTIRRPAYPADRAAFERLESAGRDRADKCRARAPELFDRMSSADHARDLDAIRAALGQRRLNFYGSSYGGILAQSYARLYPNRVRTMVLDGTMDHTAPGDRTYLDPARDESRLLRRYFSWCDEHDSCALSGNAETRWREVTAAADREPIPTDTEDVVYDGDDLRALSVGQLRSATFEKSTIDTAVVSAERGDGSGFVPESGRPYPSMPVPGVVECLDWPRPRSASDARRLAHKLRAIAPLSATGGALLRGILTCAGWPTPVTNLPRRLPAGLPPLLGAGTRAEYATTDRAVKQVPGSASILEDAPGHTLYSYNTCARKHINRYLRTAQTPAPRTECPSDVTPPSGHSSGR